MAVTTKRLKWLKWLYPGEDGLQSDQNWHLEKRRRHMGEDHVPGIVSGLGVIETSPTPDLEVHVQVGRAVGGQGEEIVLESIEDIDLSSYASGGATVKIVAEYAEQGTDPYIVPETSTSQDKFTQDVPTITAITGALSADQILLAQVVVTNGATQITDAVDSDNPGNNEIDLRDRAASNPRGLKMVKDRSVDAELSTVTVGEFGCDFRDIGAALSFINGLSRSSSRQIAVLLFGKESGEFWGISTAITIPTWTHLIGVGKPTIKTNVTSGDVITLSDGSSFMDVCVENIATGWAYQIASSADDVTIENVDVRHEHASVNAGYALGIKTGNRIRIKNFRLFPNAATPTNGCRGIAFSPAGLGVDDVEIVNCYLAGDQLLFHQLVTRVDQMKVTNLHLVATSTSASTVFGQLAGVTGTLTNVIAQCVAGPGFGFIIGGNDGFDMVNIEVTCSSSDDVVLLSVEDTRLTNFKVVNGRLRLDGDVVASCGMVDFDAAAGGVGAINVLGSNVIISGVEIDRGGQNAPGIGVFADYGVVSGCHITNTGTSPSIEGGSGYDLWTIQGCVTDVSPDPNGGMGWNIACEEGDVRKSADESVDSGGTGTTLQDDDELKFYMKANKKYDFEVVAFFDTGAGGIKFAVNGPTGLQDLRSHFQLLSGSGDPNDANAQFAIRTAYEVVSGATAAISGVAYFKGSIENGSTAGNLVLRWAQNGASAVASTVQKGSYLRFREVH